MHRIRCKMFPTNISSAIFRGNNSLALGISACTLRDHFKNSLNVDLKMAWMIRISGFLTNNLHNVTLFVAYVGFV